MNFCHQDRLAAATRRLPTKRTRSGTLLALTVTLSGLLLETPANAAPQTESPPASQASADQIERLQTAIAADQEQAVELARELVAAHNTEDAARFLLEQLYVGKQWSKLSERERMEFGQLLKSLRAAQPDDIGVKQLYADYLIASERARSALPLLEELASVQPMRGLQAAVLARQLGDEDEATRLAEICLEATKLMSKKDPGNTTISLAFAHNQLFLSRHAAAVALLDKAIEAAKPEADISRLLGTRKDAISNWVRSIELSPNNTAEQRLKNVQATEKILALAPDDRQVIMLVMKLVIATMDDEDPQIKKTREALMENCPRATAFGTNNAEMLLPIYLGKDAAKFQRESELDRALRAQGAGIDFYVKGTAALMSDDLETAIEQLTVAAKLMPRSGAALNNLAVAMSRQPDANLEQALMVSNDSIEKTPTPSPHFYETRAQILLKLERYEAAIPDFKKAVTDEGLAATAHKALATCYEETGQPARALMHRKLATPAKRR